MENGWVMHIAATHYSIIPRWMYWLNVYNNAESDTATKSGGIPDCRVDD